MIYFVTVNYYSTDLIKQLLASLRMAADAHCQVVIVNNSPDDRSVDGLAEPGWITVLTAERNLGFGGGCNLGIRYVYEQDSQAIIWLINPDAELVTDAVAYVRQCLATEPDIAILGTRIQDLDGRLWFSRGTFNPWLGSLKHRFEAVNTTAQPPATEETEWVSGCSMMFNLAVFETCPLFDRQYFLDYEDAEISYRYLRQGKRVRVTRAVLVHHQVSAITGRNVSFKFRHATFSKLYFLHQYGTPLALGLNLVYTLGKVLLRLPRQPHIARGRWQGLLEFLNRWRQGFFCPEGVEGR